MASGKDPNSTALSGYYQKLMKQSQGNPYLENMIATARTNAQQGLGSNLKRVRSGGFRGGGAADAINQAGVVSNFENQLAQNEANLRYQDANQGQALQLQGANSLSQMSAQQAASATALLQALQGNSTKQAGRSDKKAISHSITSGYESV